ncbi:MAG: SdhC [Desulfobacteraceae bacterium 4572_130]|nr:MAG: SdhC [Desulfobacteraceae bacterium 4572_130]
MENLIINDNIKKSRLPARLDLVQSGTGLVLGLFMWAHMFLISSILLGKGAFNFVAKTMELSFLSETGEGYPFAVFFAVLVIFTLFIIHAALGVRKFPISWKQHRIFRSQMSMMKHQDTNLWYVQVITGFIMFFLGSVHLYLMLTNPGQIDPNLSADRIISHNMWPLYLGLLFSVELHGTIGLYRLCMKWGWFAGKDPRESRKKLKVIKNKLTIFFLALGLLALLVFSIMGIMHKKHVGEPYEKKEVLEKSMHIKTSPMKKEIQNKTKSDQHNTSQNISNDKKI